MLQVIIGIAVVLILCILILLFRVQSLISVLRGSDKKVGTISNKFNGGMFLLFFLVMTGLFFWYSFSASDTYMLPTSASDHGIATDRMFWVTMAIITAAFLLTNALLFIFAYKYQHKKDRVAAYFPENNILELAWTVIPAIVLTLLVFQGFSAWTKVTDIPDASEDPDRVVLEIMGQQFGWSVRYPGPDGQLGKHDFRLIEGPNGFGIDLSDEHSYDDFTPTEIHIPKGGNVLFRIRSRDVLHSVFAPHFRLKMDAVPGMPTQFYFTPNKTTQEMRNELRNQDFNYEIACAEMCGRSHFGMRYIIVVDEKDEYEEWEAKQKAWVSMNADFVKENGIAQYIDKYLPKEEEAQEDIEIDESGVPLDSASMEVDSVSVGGELANI